MAKMECFAGRLAPKEAMIVTAGLAATAALS